MKHTRLKTRLALCTVGMVLLVSCGSKDTTPLADSSKLPASPTLPPAEQTGSTTTIVVWDPSVENSTIPKTDGSVVALTPEEEIAAGAVVKNLFESSFRKDAPEIILGNIERSDEFIAAAKLTPIGIQQKPGLPAPSSFTVSIESVERFHDVACADVAAQPSCVGVRFYLALDGKPYSRELLAHVYQKDGIWIWTAFSFCRVMYNIGQKCLIDVPKAPFELKNPDGSAGPTSTTVSNG